MLKFIVHPGTDGKFYVRITSANNEPWFSSEGYETRHGAHASIHDFISLLRNVSAVEDGKVEIDFDITDETVAR